MSSGLKGVEFTYKVVVSGIIFCDPVENTPPVFQHPAKVSHTHKALSELNIGKMSMTELMSLYFQAFADIANHNKDAARLSEKQKSYFGNIYAIGVANVEDELIKKLVEARITELQLGNSSQASQPAPQ